MSQFDALVKADIPLPEMSLCQASKTDIIIGKLLADNLIEDGATLQLGLFNRYSYLLLWSPTLALARTLGCCILCISFIDSR